jgi:arsenite/tail-anchored protein-transporting ATPase
MDLCRRKRRCRQDHHQVIKIKNCYFLHFSSSLAIQLSKVRESVLLISTDPAHNLSDAFNQKFGKDPALVNGFKNLYAMEIDPAAGMEEAKNEVNGAGGSEDNPMSAILGDMSMALPGIDEAMGFAQVMKLIQSMEYSVIVFDTAPTGHTLRFLSFPAIMEKALGKFSQLGGKFGGMFQQIGSMMGMSMDQEAIFSKINEMTAVVKEVNRQFQNPDLTTFVCVCISEFLSLYETERMIQELTAYHIDTHNIVVNQLLFPNAQSNCSQCLARRKMQKKYLNQIDELYEDFHIVKLPLLSQEVRGPESLKEFSENLVKPFPIDNSYDD